MRYQLLAAGAGMRNADGSWDNAKKWTAKPVPRQITVTSVVGRTT